MLLSADIVLAVALFVAVGDVLSDPGGLGRVPIFISVVDGVDMSEPHAEAPMYGVEYDSVVVGLKGIVESLSGVFGQLSPGREPGRGKSEGWKSV